jgi:IS30 family transposase
MGDWEGDTVVGRNHRGALVTLVERKSKITLIRKGNHYTAKAVNRATCAMTRQYRDILKTITVDNGREFSGHEALAQMTGAEICFAHPYHSWERGLNENTNGLIRQYFPKKTDFNEVRDAQIQKVQDLLNDRPRKTLGYLSPNEYLVKEQYKTN